MAEITLIFKVCILCGIRWVDNLSVPVTDDSLYFPELLVLFPVFLTVNSAFIPSQVVFNVNNGAGRITASSRSAASMCDGRWRTLVAKKQKHSLSLTVDGVTVTVENPYSSSTSAETKNPIYVGGYPGMAFLSTALCPFIMLLVIWQRWHQSNISANQKRVWAGSNG